ncbi:MAG TPA: hypothetical protein PK079_21435 [Leptospiraceae bacterium]|nr:hypothetical protein [Leptospiraceae bacterium]HMX31215.1 hypothetical protein [Leptospiraceae bacterium]HMY29421.1 hypothetical protein [Leptospiraceae bacterium]HMZ65831.1 hypothetical protein [Leptospiraceae bacterium]HNA06392.1 hypothetical protein [Leptospiraceae bacterium]
MIFISCRSFPGKRALNLSYTNPSNCGFFQFYRDGSFRYDLGSSEQCVDNKSKPRINDPTLGNIGKYSFESKTDVTPYLIQSDKEIDEFKVRFDEDLKNLFVKRKGSSLEEKFGKLK